MSVITAMPCLGDAMRITAEFKGFFRSGTAGVVASPMPAFGDGGSASGTGYLPYDRISTITELPLIEYAVS